MAKRVAMQPAHRAVERCCGLLLHPPVAALSCCRLCALPCDATRCLARRDATLLERRRAQLHYATSDNPIDPTDRATVPFLLSAMRFVAPLRGRG